MRAVVAIDANLRERWRGGGHSACVHVCVVVAIDVNVRGGGCSESLRACCGGQCCECKRGGEVGVAVRACCGGRQRECKRWRGMCACMLWWPMM